VSRRKVRELKKEVACFVALPIFQNDETDPSTGYVHALSLLKLDKNDFIEGG